jgi:hypothetical protein
MDENSISRFHWYTLYNPSSGVGCSLSDIMPQVIKFRALNSRIFKKLHSQTDAASTSHLPHAEARRMSTDTFLTNVLEELKNFPPKRDSGIRGFIPQR